MKSTQATQHFHLIICSPCFKPASCHPSILWLINCVLILIKNVKCYALYIYIYSIDFISWFLLWKDDFPKFKKVICPVKGIVLFQFGMTIDKIPASYVTILGWSLASGQENWVRAITNCAGWIMTLKNKNWRYFAFEFMEKKLFIFNGELVSYILTLPSLSNSLRSWWARQLPCFFWVRPKAMASVFHQKQQVGLSLRINIFNKLGVRL